MDANEAHGHSQNALARQRMAGLAAGIDNPAAQAAIREAHANLAREKARQLIEQAEIFDLFATDTTEDEVFVRLQALNFKAMGVQVIPGSRWRGTQDRGELVFIAHDWDQWLPNFEYVAQRLGYVKGPRTR